MRTLAGFRFENLAINIVDDFSADDRLLVPRVNIINDVFVGEVAAEERGAQVFECLSAIGRRKQRPAHTAPRLVQQDRFTFAFLWKENLINKIGRRVR